MKAAGSQAEVKKLKKELADAKKQIKKSSSNSSESSAGDEDPKKKDAELELLRKQVEDLKKENKQYEDKLQLKDSEISVSVLFTILIHHRAKAASNPKICLL